MSRNAKYFKSGVVVLMTLFVGVFFIYNVAPKVDNDLIIHGDRELVWDVPMDDANRGPLADLTGYKIHCWNAEDRQSETIVIQNPETTRYTLDQLWSGTYQCALSATRSDGSQSALSNVVVRTIP